MAKVIHLIKQTVLWTAWLVAMGMLNTGFGIQWILKRALPSLSRIIEKIEVALNGSSSEPTTET